MFATSVAAVEEFLCNRLVRVSPRYPQSIVVILPEEQDSNRKFSRLVKDGAYRAKKDTLNVCVNGVLVNEVKTCTEMPAVVASLIFDCNELYGGQVFSLWCSWYQIGTLYLGKGCSRNYPGGGEGPALFSDPSTPRTSIESERPTPRTHLRALINPPHYGSNMPWPPGQVTLPPPPTPRTRCQHPPQDKKVPAAHPALRIISGTALRCICF